MTPVFLDTSFLLGLVLEDDALHERSHAWQRSLSSLYLTTEYVLVELADALISPSLGETAVSTVSLLRSDPAVRIVAASTVLLDEGLRFFQRYHDKRWSLTDCISFLVMKEAGALDALTADRHFEQAGFRALLRHPPPTT